MKNKFNVIYYAVIFGVVIVIPFIAAMYSVVIHKSLFAFIFIFFVLNCVHITLHVIELHKRLYKIENLIKERIELNKSDK